MGKRAKPPAVPDILEADVVNRLTSKKDHERLEAERRIEALGPEAVDALLAAIRKEGEARVKRRNMGIGVIIALTVLTVLLAVIGGSDQIATFSSMFGVIGSMFAVSQTQKNAARALARFEDIREVGPLAEALFYDDSETAKIASEALLKLLPRLQASDAHLLTPEEHACLRNAVKRDKPEHEPLTLVILRALEQIGDDKDLPVVQGLAERDVTKPHQLRVQAAARESLPFLEKRAEQARVAKTLLRPASGPDDISTVLLRPVDAAADVDPATLVRPAGDPSGYVSTGETATTGNAQAANVTPSA